MRVHVPRTIKVIIFFAQFILRQFPPFAAGSAVVYLMRPRKDFVFNDYLWRDCFRFPDGLYFRFAVGEGHVNWAAYEAAPKAHATCTTRMLHVNTLCSLSFGPQTLTSSPLTPISNVATLKELSSPNCNSPSAHTVESA